MSWTGLLCIICLHVLSRPDSSRLKALVLFGEQNLFPKYVIKDYCTRTQVDAVVMSMTGAIGDHCTVCGFLVSHCHCFYGNGIGLL